MADEQKSNEPNEQDKPGEQQPPQDNLLTSKNIQPAKAAPKSQSIDIPEGRVEPSTGRGFDQAVLDAIMGAGLEAVAVREDQMVQINGQQFFVGGPSDGSPYQVVLLPAPIAEVLRHQIEAERSAQVEWRRGTARVLGGVKPDEVR